VEGVLARGRFGVTYRARHKELGTPARLVVLVAGEHGNPRELAELRDRVGAARAFGHHNLVHVTEVWTQPSDPTRPIESLWVAYQHVDGFTLEQKLADGPVFWGQAGEWGLEVLDALAPLHAAGVFHLAVWPANLWRDAEGRTRLGEVGLGREQALGPYAAPEQVAGTDVGVATDLWGVGATLWALTAGRPPFADDDPERLAKLIRASNPPKLPSLVPECSAGFDKVVRRCLAPNPRRRYTSAAELAADLGRVLAGQPPRSAGTTRLWNPFGG
jgi:serine/threonine protein kinase